VNRAGRTIAAALAFALATQTGSAVAAEDVAPPPATPAAPAIPAQPTAGAEAAAKAAFSQGGDAFRLGNYAEAIQHYEDAYRLSHKVEVLFNIALSNRRAYGIEQKPEYLRRSLDIYQQFLRLAENASELDAARQNMNDVVRELGALEERERIQRLRSGGDPPQIQAAMKLTAEGRPADAVAKLEELLKRGGNPAFVVQDTYRLEGEIAAQAGKDAVSIDAYARLLALQPGFDLPKGAPARARGDFEKARAFWSEHGTFSISPVVPPPAEPDKPLIIPVAVENDALSMVSRVTVHYRRAGSARYSTVSRPGPGDIDIPAIALPGEEAEYRVEYYVAATDLHGNTLTTIGGQNAPLSFPVLSPEEVTTFYKRETPWYATWLFWTGVSALLAAGAGVGIAALAGAFNPGIPTNTLGNPLQLNARPGGLR
jgi:hypothetical protein